jgi:hypothetical protein
MKKLSLICALLAVLAAITTASAATWTFNSFLAGATNLVATNGTTLYGATNVPFQTHNGVQSYSLSTSNTFPTWVWYYTNPAGTIFTNSATAYLPPTPPVVGQSAGHLYRTNTVVNTNIVTGLAWTDCILFLNADASLTITAYGASPTNGITTNIFNFVTTVDGVNFSTAPVVSLVFQVTNAVPTTVIGNFQAAAVANAWLVGARKIRLASVVVLSTNAAAALNVTSLGVAQCVP